MAKRSKLISTTYYQGIPIRAYQNSDGKIYYRVGRDIIHSPRQARAKAHKIAEERQKKDMKYIKGWD